jgi:hypothetical protein
MPPLRSSLVALRAVGRGNVPDDEDLFTRADQVKITTRDLLDRLRVIAKAAHLLAQARVLAPDASELS